jgi:hypothetical protein
MHRADQLLQLAQALADERPTLFLSKGPGAGDRDTKEFIHELRRRAEQVFGVDYAEKEICGANKLCPDYYFPDEQTVVEIAFLLKNSPSEFEKDILKAILADESGQPVRKLVFISKPGAVKRCNAPDRRSMIEWAERVHGLSIAVHELRLPETASDAR